MSRKPNIVRCMTGAILSLGLVAHAHAVPIPDQVFTSPNGTEFGLPSTPSTHFQQGVTAGLSGLLSQIDIFFSRTDGPGSGSPPPADVLFSVNLGAPWQSDANDFEQHLYFDVGQAAGVVQIDVSSANIVVSPGDLFSIGLQTSGSNAVTPYFTGAILDDHYKGGALWLDQAPLFIGTSDLNFVTYVGSPSPIPEPSGLMLLVVGLSGLRLARATRT